VTQPLLSDEVVTAHEAIASYRAGRHRATQALAGVLVGALIEGRLGMTFAKAHGLFETLDHEEAVQEIRVTAVARSVAHALTTYRSGDPAPPRFNRHATLHGTAPGHYTVANALTGLLLACNTIRELDFWLGRVGENGSNAS
jgi:hypothetical protein